MVHSKNSNPKKINVDRLPPLMPEAHASSWLEEYNFKRENTQPQLNLDKKESCTKIEAEPNFESEAQIQNFFIEPFNEQGEVVVRAVEKKPEKVVITASETDALYN